MYLRRDIDIPADQLIALCRRYRVVELSLFGSSARGDARPDSDVDLLVIFDPSAEVGFLTMAAFQRELASLIGRQVDLVPKDGLKPLIRDAVLREARVLYAA